MSSKNSIAVSEDWEDVYDPDRWIDIFDNNDLKRKIISKAPQTDEVLVSDEGTSQPNVPKKPKNGDVVKIKVSGYLETGDFTERKEVDKFDEIEFELGLYDVIEAWELAVQLMVKGDIHEIKTSPRFAYGSTGRRPDIPANTSITYTIELLSIEPGLNVYEFSPDQRVIFCEKRKDRGNYYFKREEYDRAAAVYQKGTDAAEIAHSFPNYDDNLRATLVALYNNLAMIALKLNNWNNALEATEKCLSIEANNAKSLYRRAKALQGKQDYESALKVYETIGDIKDTKLEIVKCKEYIKRDKERMKRMCGRMILAADDQENQWSTHVRRTGYAALAGFAALGAALTYRFMYKSG